MKFFSLIALVGITSAVRFYDETTYHIDPNETKDQRDTRVNAEAFAASRSGLGNTALKTPFEKGVIERAEQWHSQNTLAGQSMVAGKVR
tara:strand:+ start:112 stop:378 length:267 start_codon:yes stop_codon:yes gene_type:complete